MKITLPQIRLFSVILSVAILSFATGWFSNERTGGRLSLPGTSNADIEIDRTIPKEHSDVNFALFWQVWDRLESDYYDKSKLNKEEMVLGAIKGMVGAIGDPYTAFLPPAEQKRTQEDLSGHFEGVGIEIGFKGTRLTVMAPLEGSPAAKAGIQTGDYIVGIKDTEKNIEVGTGGMTLLDAVDHIRGKAGSKVILIVSREGVEKPLEFEITRAKIEVPSVVLSFQGENKDIAVLQLKKFGGNTDVEWNNAIAQIQARKPKGMVLDVRNNPGGYLKGAVNYISEFIPSGVAVVQEGGKEGKKELSVSGKPRLPEVPMVVLVNGGSASASEIMAGALKDHSRARIVGQTTFGKGTIQEARPVNGSSGLHVTVAKWLTPNGTWVHEVGLKPDVEVENKADTDNDEQMDKALELLR